MTSSRALKGAVSTGLMLALSLLAAVPTPAQEATATLRGTVKDPSGGTAGINPDCARPLSGCCGTSEAERHPRATCQIYNNLSNSMSASHESFSLG